MKIPATYIMTNRRNETLYTGVTSDLVRRVWQYKQGNSNTKGFSANYKTTMLVYFELCDDMLSAITREKQIKAGSRKKKLLLIEQANPNWRDLYTDILP